MFISISYFAVTVTLYYDFFGVVCVFKADEISRQKEEERDIPSLSSSLLRERESVETTDEADISSRELVQGIVDNLIDNVVLGQFSLLKCLAVALIKFFIK